MKSPKVIFLVFVLCSIIWGQDIHDISPKSYYVEPEIEKIAEEAGQVEILSVEEIATSDGRVFDFETKRIAPHRQIVISAVMMMIFAGLAMASVSSINPE